MDGDPAMIVESALFAGLRSLGEWPRATLRDECDVTYLLTDVPFALMNSVFGVHFADRSADARIQAVFEARQRPMMWWIGPGAAPGDIGDRLVAEGLRADAGGPGMIVEIAASSDVAPPDGLHVETAGEGATLSEWAVPIRDAFRIPDFAMGAMLDAYRTIPGWRHFVGKLDDKPVGASSVFISDGVAAVFNVATVSDARRLGIASWMTTTALRDAASRGCKVAVLQSSTMGLRVYERLGFATCCTISCYVRT